MPDGITVDVQGIEKANRNMKVLEYKMRKKVITKAVRAGSKVALAAIRQEAPSDTGALKRSFHVSVNTDRRTGTVAGQAKLNRKRKATKRDSGRRPSKYMHLVVLGTAPHTIRGWMNINGNVRSLVDHPGARPNDFVGRAARRSDRKSLETFTRQYGDGVDQAVRELPK